MRQRIGKRWGELKSERFEFFFAFIYPHISFTTLVNSMNSQLVCVEHLYLKICQWLVQKMDMFSYGGAVSRAAAGCQLDFQGKHPSSGVP